MESDHIFKANTVLHPQVFCRIVIFNLLCIFVFKFDIKQKALISSILEFQQHKNQHKMS